MSLKTMIGVLLLILGPVVLFALILLS